MCAVNQCFGLVFLYASPSGWLPCGALARAFGPALSLREAVSVSRAGRGVSCTAQGLGH